MGSTLRANEGKMCHSRYEENQFQLALEACFPDNYTWCTDDCCHENHLPGLIKMLLFLGFLPLEFSVTEKSNIPGI